MRRLQMMAPKPDPIRWAERLAVTKVRPGRRGKNTSRRLVESAVRWPMVRLFAPRPTTRRHRVAPAGHLSLREARARSPLKATRQSRGNQPRSKRRLVAAKAAAKRRKLPAGWVQSEKKTSPEVNPVWIVGQQELLPIQSEEMKAMIRRRSQASPFPAAQRKTRWRVSQSLPDRGLPTSGQKRLGASVHFLNWLTMSASRSLGDHLYSWY